MRFFSLANRNFKELYRDPVSILLVNVLDNIYWIYGYTVILFVFGILSFHWKTSSSN